MTVSSSEPSSFRLAATLAVAGLASGLALAGIYLGTRDRIRQNRAEALRAAIFHVLPGTKTIVTYAVRNGELVKHEGPAGSTPDGKVVYAGLGADGHLVGNAIPAEGAGFQDAIKLIYGYEPSKKIIVGMEVLESRETPGLGDKIVGDRGFHANFEALAIEPKIVGVKNGTKTKPNEVDMITGATISSKAVIAILDRSTNDWKPILGARSESAGGE